MVGCNKEGRREGRRHSKKGGIPCFGERWISNCRLPAAPVFVSIEEEEEEGKKTITRGKNGGRHRLIVRGREE